MQFSITGDDQFIFQGLSGVDNISNDLADGDIGVLTVPNNLINLAVGKNKNAIYALDESGRQFELELRVLKGSNTDAAFVDKVNSYLGGNFAGLTFLTGSVTKMLGDGQGNLKKWVVQLSGGVVRKLPETRTNVNGDTEQSVSIYTIVGVIDSLSIE
jgi:hypothetical protein